MSPNNVRILQRLQRQEREQLDLDDREIENQESIIRQKASVVDEAKKRYDRAEFDKDEAIKARNDWQEFLKTCPDGGNQKYRETLTELILKESEAITERGNALAHLQSARDELSGAQRDIAYLKHQRQQTFGRLSQVNKDIEQIQF